MIHINACCITVCVLIGAVFTVPDMTILNTSWNVFVFYICPSDESWDTVPEAVRETTKTDHPDKRDSIPKSDETQEQEEKEERLNVKETPNRTDPDNDVDKNNEKEETVDILPSQNTSQIMEKQEEEEVGEAASTKITDGVKELTLRMQEDESQENLKEERSPTESSNGSSCNKGNNSTSIVIFDLYCSNRGGTI